MQYIQGSYIINIVGGGPGNNHGVNTFHDEASAYSKNYKCNFNPLDKYIEQVEKNEKLYEALLKSESEKIALLERMLDKK